MELPPGFRFHPTDEELVMHYLCRKCASQPIAVPNVIAEIDLYQHNPWELPGLALYGEKEWYFFSPRERKYPNGSRPNRTAGSGYWKATGADKAVGRPKVVAIKKALVFYTGKAPKGEKSNWIMHEYRLADVDRSARTNNSSSRLDDWVLCRIYNKKGTSISSQQLGSRRLSESVQQKPQFLTNSRGFPLPPPLPRTGALTELVYLDSSDSMPRLHTDSSTSEQQVAWPDFGCDMEVESQPKLEDWEKPPALHSLYNYLDATALDASVFQGSSLMSPL